ncbi:MAG: hypothetical protein PVG39_19435 [Desulfobacteraceae bacterium]|jgi:hypothetical protein
MILTDIKLFFILFSILLIMLFTQNLYANEGPALPKGLLSGNSIEKRETNTKGTITFPFTGFIEARSGRRLYDDAYEKDSSIGEVRLQLEMEKQLNRFLIELTTDIYYDAVPEDHSVDLEKGEGFIDLRELSVSFSVFDFMDIKAGRQVLTWGTGDLVFINDLFPKDWQSFLIGRDTEYLKAPSDAFKASIFTGPANIDIVYTPEFDPDRFITGERLSYWNGYRIAGRDSIIQADRPGDWFDNDEWAVRLSKNIKGNEFALYGYHGYWKSPGGMDASTSRYIFPQLNVYGASIRGQTGKGIGNIEAGYYDSGDDSSGNNPLVNNSQFRLLVGYEQDLPRLASDLTAGFQYYLEHMMDHDEYLSTLPSGMTAADEDRHLFTLRITRLFLNQNLTCSLFTYYSPSDQDFYILPNVNYKFTDNLEAEMGANIFGGEYPNTFFGQFHDNTNMFMAVRYNY